MNDLTRKIMANLSARQDDLRPSARPSAFPQADCDASACAAKGAILGEDGYRRAMERAVKLVYAGISRNEPAKPQDAFSLKFGAFLKIPNHQGTPGSGRGADSFQGARGTASTQGTNGARDIASTQGTNGARGTVRQSNRQGAGPETGKQGLTLAELAQRVRRS
jgi:hypothetical protein